MTSFFLVLSAAVAGPAVEEHCLSLPSLAAHLRLGVTSELEREIVLVPSSLSADDHKALGVALHAQVSEEEGRLRIARPKQIRRELQVADAEWVQSQAQAASDRVLGAALRYDASPSFGVLETYRKIQERLETDRAAGKVGLIDDTAFQAMELSPASRLLARLLRSVPPQIWSQAPPGTTTTFSSRPLGNEHPLGDLVPDLATYVAEETRLAEWAQGLGAGEVEQTHLPLPKRMPKTGERTVLLRVERQGSTPSFELSIFDRDGTFEDGASLFTRESPGARKRPDASKLGLVPLSSETRKAMAEAVPGGKGFRPETLDIVSHEPLDTYVREALLRYGEAKGFAKVIACVPDELYATAWKCLRKGQIDLDALADALARAAVEEIPRGKTLVLRPARPIEEEALRVDRRPLTAAYLRAAAGRFDDDALLALHAGYAANYTDPFPTALWSRLDHAYGLSQSPNWSLPHPFLAALGELTTAERDRLKAGSAVRLDPNRHPVSLLRLAQDSGRLLSLPGSLPPGTSWIDPNAPKIDQPKGLSDLDRSPTRLLAKGVWLDGETDLWTRIKRVSQGVTSIQKFNPLTGETETKTGANLVIDSTYLPLDHPLLLGMLTSDDALRLESVARKYRFFWRQDRRFLVTVRFGTDVRVGPVALLQPVKESKDSVPLREVPGLNWRGK